MNMNNMNHPSWFLPMWSMCTENMNPKRLTAIHYPGPSQDLVYISLPSFVMEGFQDSSFPGVQPWSRQPAWFNTPKKLSQPPQHHCFCLLIQCLKTLIYTQPTPKTRGIRCGDSELPISSLIIQLLN